MEPSAKKEEAEFEVTEEMVAAGLEAISGFELLDAWEGHLDKAELVRSILYKAMSRRSPKSP